MNVQCVNCKNVVDIPVTEEQIQTWKDSKQFIQDYFPELSPDHREMFLSGYCGKCFDNLGGLMYE